MVLILIAFIGGALTILSPCILPVLPFVFARAGQPFVRSVLPMLVGMALTFAAVATLAAVGGGWAVRANEYGRYAALAMLVCFGLLLLVPHWMNKISSPVVALGNRLTQSAGSSPAGSIGASLVLGVATGLLWAPCAGPILGLILTGAALGGASLKTSVALLAYALGAATSLAVARLAGGRLFAAMKRSPGVSVWARRALGAAVLAGVAIIGSGLDTGALARLSVARTTDLEQSLLHTLGAADTSAAEPMPAAAARAAAPTMPRMVATAASAELGVEGPAPALDGAVQWLNSPELNLRQLRGKVVLVDFWTYSCVNCQRTLPYVTAWARKYRDHGLTVIGVHAPEFAFEKNIDNVKQAIQDLHIDYPVAIDNNFAIWRRFHNEYWPARYLIDAHGRIRAHHFGEGEYDITEHQIQQLLSEGGPAPSRAM